MSEKFVLIQGLKGTCVQCQKTFQLQRSQQRLLFSREPFKCSSCNCLLGTSVEQLEILKAKGNPGWAYMKAMGVMGLCGMTFFGLVLLGVITSDGAVLLAIVLAIGGQFAISVGFKGATEDLKIPLQNANPPPLPTEAAGQAGPADEPVQNHDQGQAQP